MVFRRCLRAVVTPVAGIDERIWCWQFETQGFVMKTWMRASKRPFTCLGIHNDVDIREKGSLAFKGQSPDEQLEVSDSVARKPPFLKH